MDLHGHDAILTVLLVLVVVLLLVGVLMGMFFSADAFIGPVTKFDSDLVTLDSISTSLSFVRSVHLDSVDGDVDGGGEDVAVVVFFSLLSELTMVRSSSYSFFDSIVSAAEQRLVDGCGDPLLSRRFRYFSSIWSDDKDLYI